MSMPVIAALLLLSGAALFLLLRALGTPLTHPLILTIVPQVLILGFTYTNLNSKLEMFQPLTWIIILGSWASFLVGALAATLGTSRWKRLPQVSAVEYEDPWLLVSLLAVVYLVGFVWGISRVGTLPILAKHPEQARAHFIGSYFQEFLTSFMIPIVTLCLLALQKGSSRRFRVFAALTGSVVFLLYLSTGNRMLSLLVLVTLLAALDVLVRPIKIRTILLSTLVGVLLFVGVGYLRYGRFVNSTSHHAQSKAAELALRGVYDYAGNGYWNLDYALSKMDDGSITTPTYGGSTGEGALVLIGVKDPIQIAYRWDGALNPSVTKLHGLNSTSFHWALVKDFGVGAPLIWSFLWGLGLTALSRYARYTRSPRATLVFGILSYYSFIGFLIMPFIIPPPVEGTLVLCACLLFFLKPKPRSEEQLP